MFSTKIPSGCYWCRTKFNVFIQQWIIKEQNNRGKKCNYPMDSYTVPIQVCLHEVGSFPISIDANSLWYYHSETHKSITIYICDIIFRQYCSAVIHYFIFNLHANFQVLSREFGKVGAIILPYESKWGRSCLMIWKVPTFILRTNSAFANNLLSDTSRQGST